MTTTQTPANTTPFGFSSYPHQYTCEPIYFREDDPRVKYTDTYVASRGKTEWFWRDTRTSEQKEADQLAALEAKRKWQTAQDALAIQERQKYEQKQAEQKRIREWRNVFHTREELEKLKPLTFAIDGWLQEESITMVGGPSGDGKTLIALEMVKCLLDGSALFGHFTTVKPAERIVYLIPESGARAFKHRLEIFKLMPCVGTRLFVRTLDSPDPDALITDPRILEACKGADVFLDTAVRFMDGDENASGDSKRFAQNLFALIRAKARTVTGLHHSPKDFQRAQMMTLENVLRGSGDIGAMLATCWGILQIDHETTSIYVQNTKPRDFVPCAPFVITGRPHIDKTGHFEMTTKPGFAESFAALRQRINGNTPGRPKTERSKVNEALRMRKNGAKPEEIAEALEVGRATVFRWLKAADGSETE